MAEYNSTVPKPQKCMIQNLDEGGEPIVANFNPKEIGIDKQVPWNKHKSTKSNIPLLEFTDADSKKCQFELFFDGFEEQVDVYKKYVSALEKLTEIVEAKKRPPMCLFIWANFPKFMGVVESLSTKYTMFLSDGTPVRATCTVTMKQAEKLAGAKDEAEKPPQTGQVEKYDANGKVVAQGDERRPDKVNPNDHRGVLTKSGSENGQLTVGDPAFGDLE